MAISKIKGGAINDNAISTAKIQDDAVTDPKIVDSYTTSVKTNPEFQGTEAARMPVGTTAERANPQGGDIRFNSTTSLMEYYDGVQWKSIDSPPAISSISPSNIADSDSSVDITINGSNFITGGQTVTAIGSDGSTISAGTVTRVSNTELTANFNGTSFLNAQEPYDIKVENNASGLSITSADVLNVNASPAWTVSAGSLGTVYDSGRTGVSFTTGATDSEGASLTYSVSVGSLPAGLSINSSTGTISGTATAVGSDTTSTFTLSVTDGSNTVTRQYSITVLAPVITSYTSTGSGTFSVPSGITAVDVLVVAGGGGGGCWVGSGGGAGGLIYRPAFPVTPGGSVSYTVGSGGTGAANNGSYTGLADAIYQFSQRGQEAPNAAKIGQDSSFGTLTALGGGRGGSYAGPGTPEPDGHVHTPGGSGGGAPANSSAPNTLFGQKASDYVSQGIQPSQPGDSGTYGFGNNGGTITGSEPYSPYACAGGGGAGAVGGQGNGNGSQAGAGGGGKQYDISGSQVYYAGGGGGGVHGPGGTGGSGGQGGGGNGVAATTTAAGQAQANRGGGGGGGGNNGGSPSSGGTGGSGIVIVKY